MYNTQELIKLVEYSTGSKVLASSIEWHIPAYRFLLSSQDLVRAYENGEMYYLVNGDEDMRIYPKVAQGALGYYNGTYIQNRACISDEAYEGKMRVKEEYYDPKKYNKEKDEEEFWGMVRKLQYHRSASKGSVA